MKVQLKCGDEVLYEWDWWPYAFIHAPGSIIKFIEKDSTEKRLFMVEKLIDRTVYQPDFGTPVDQSFLEIQVVPYIGEN